MRLKQTQQIINCTYINIQRYFNLKIPHPIIELHKDIYARLSKNKYATGEYSKIIKAEYDEDLNKIFIYYPNIKNEEDLLRSLIHEYTHFMQKQRNPELLKSYREVYSYDKDPNELEALSNEKYWQMFSQK